jgi:hypothetical protein
MPLLECVSVILRGDDAPPLEVEGYTLRGAPGLAVTPARTGIETTSATYYCVTHTDSGMRIGDQYTPFDAVNLMAELHTLDIDWTLPREAFNHMLFGTDDEARGKLRTALRKVRGEE